MSMYEHKSENFLFSYSLCQPMFKYVHNFIQLVQVPRALQPLDLICKLKLVTSLGPLDLEAQSKAWGVVSSLD